MRQRQTFNGFGLILIAMLIFMMASGLTGAKALNLTQQEYMQEVESGKVTKAYIQPNQETPTGAVILMMEDDSQKQV